jgi:ribosomal protein L35AE/L33A
VIPFKNFRSQINEAFQLYVGDKVAFKNKGKMLYGKVTELEKVLGKPGVVVKWSDGTNGRFAMAAFANITGDKQADYVVSERRNK